MPRNRQKKVKNTNLNVKLSKSDYEKLQIIAESIGGITLSSMIRILIYSQLDKVEKSKKSKDFLALTNYKSNEPKTQVMNVKLSESDYTKIKDIANEIGLTISEMIRLLIYSRLEKVDESNENKDFLN